MTDIKALLRTLSESGVEFILVGGVAAAAHGSARLTQDVDVVYRRTEDNTARLAAALADKITGGGNFEDLLPHTIAIKVFGIECRCLELKHLIHVKRAAGRPRDLEAVVELEAILREKGEGPPDV